MTPLVSVVVPTRNRPEMLGHALASIAAQDLPADAMEAVVVNDGGVDVTGVVENAREAGLFVRSLRLPNRHGLPAARNVGLSQARGDCIAFLDDDDVFLPNHLSVALSALDEVPEDAAVYTTCLVSTTRTDPAGPVASVGAFDYGFCRDLLTVANYIPVHSVVVRGLRASGARFDPSLPLLEDWDMWLRLVIRHGYRFHHVAEPTVVYHRIASDESMTGAGSAAAAALVRFATIQRLLWRRWPPANRRAARFRLYFIVMNWHALSHMATGGQVALRYYERALRAIADAWAGTEPEDALIESLAHAVQEESDSDQQAA